MAVPMSAMVFTTLAPSAALSASLALKGWMVPKACKTSARRANSGSDNSEWWRD